MFRDHYLLHVAPNSLCVPLHFTPLPQPDLFTNLHQQHPHPKGVVVFPSFPQCKEDLPPRTVWFVPATKVTKKNSSARTATVDKPRWRYRCVPREEVYSST